MCRQIRRLFLLFLIFTVGLGGIPVPKIHLYVLPFENIQNDPSVEWLKTAFTDMLNLEFKDNNLINLRDRDALEKLMSNRNQLLHQPRGTKNFLVLGKFERALDQISVDVQLIDIATWDEVDHRTTEGLYSKIPALNAQVVDIINAMLTPFVPEEEQEKPVPAIVDESRTERKKMRNQMEDTGVSIDLAIDDLEESMDLVIGARGKPQPDEPTVSDGEWTLDISGEDFSRENPELVGNTEMLMKVLDDLTDAPYDIRLSKPRFEYDEDDRDRMSVVLPVRYALKEHLINDMLTSLPYSGLKQDGSLTVFYFNRDRFNFPSEAMEAIRHGRYRAIPVIRFFDNEGRVVAIIVDSAAADLHDLASEQVVYTAAHNFSPLIIFTVGGWSLQVAMETVEIPVEYHFEINLDQVNDLSRVSLKFVPEGELRGFLENYL